MSLNYPLNTYLFLAITLELCDGAQDEGVSAFVLGRYFVGSTPDSVDTGLLVQRLTVLTRVYWPNA